MSEPENTNGRVTMRTLDDKIALIRQEQKNEHLRTRFVVVLFSLPNLAKALPFVIGYFGWHFW